MLMIQVQYYTWLLMLRNPETAIWYVIRTFCIFLCCDSPQSKYTLSALWTHILPEALDLRIIFGSSLLALTCFLFEVMVSKGARICWTVQIRPDARQ